MAINFLNRFFKRSICVQQRVDSNKDIYINKKADSEESAFSISLKVLNSSKDMNSLKTLNSLKSFK